MEKKSFIKACKDHFGYRGGDSIKEFSGELKMLTIEDRQDLAVEFAKIGIEVEAPQIFVA
jgi:hypothetical protein